MRQRISETLDFFYPRTCEACGRPVDRPGRLFCSDCLNRLPFTPTDGCCRRCGRAAEGLDGEFLCEDCRTYRPSFDRAASALSFEGDARDAINAFKFRKHLWLRNDLVDWMEAVTRARFRIEEIDVVVAMPSTFLHRLDRGYNQCAYLAKALARRLGRPYVPFALRRKGNPKKQGRLTEEERRTNVIGTFGVLRPRAIAGKTVMVIDDIMTTGSTLSECAAELKRAGASRVWCVTLARSHKS